MKDAPRKDLNFDVVIVTRRATIIIPRTFEPWSQPFYVAAPAEPKPIDDTAEDFYHDYY